MDYETLIKKIFFTVCTLLATLLIWNANKVVGSLDRLEKSVHDLNVNVAVVIQKVSDHEKRIERLEGSK